MSNGKKPTKRRRPSDGDARNRYKSRGEQIMDLAVDSVVTVVEGTDDTDVGARLELYVKERPRGQHYVADFVYSDQRLPVTVSGILLQTQKGLVIGELELFRVQWGYVDDYGASMWDLTVNGGRKTMRTGMYRHGPILWISGLLSKA